MALRDTLDRLLEGARRAPHDYRDSTSSFAELNIEQISVDLKLEKRGRERGESNEPKADDIGYDEVELEIIDKIESEKNGAFDGLNDHLATFSERLSALNIESRFTIIETASLQAVADFKVGAHQGRDHLHAKRRRLRDIEQELSHFKKAGGLNRVARDSSIGMKALKISLLFFMLLVETFVNGSFLAKGSELGLIGGTVEAFSFAVMNIVGSVLIALFGVRQLNHKNFVTAQVVGR